jgi:HEAT repeat protein
VPHTRGDHRCAFFAPTFRAGALAVAAVVASVGLAVPAHAQAPEESVTKKTEAQLLGDFIHYINIDNYKLAAAMGNELTARKLKPRDFVTIVETGEGTERFDAASAKAQRVADLASLASSLVSSYEKGKLEIARDPDEIAKAIKMLTGNARARVLGAERLKAASEYAVPQLLAALLDNRGDAVLAAEAQNVLTAMGSRAVQPLCAALLGLDGVGQERVAMVLGDIGYPASLAYMAELRETTKNAAVRSACERGLARFNEVNGVPSSELYLALAERFAMQSADVTSFPQDEFQLIWDFAPSVGLTMTAIRTPVYHEAMAMRSVERALNLNTENPEAVALWVASNFKREIETPEGYENPVYSSERKNAMYYAVASGAQSCQRVLARAIDGKNTPLARKAIAALSKTAGGSSLWSSGLTRQPLLEAINYPNRRVQYEAAMVLGGAHPREAFAGSERVVPTLAGAIREASERNAVVFASSVEVYQAVRGMVEKAGYKVLPYGKTMNDIAQPLATAAAVDLIVTANLNAEQASNAVGEVRANAKLAASPIVILATQDNVPDLRKRYSTDSGIAVRPSAAGESAVLATIKEISDSTTGGPISADESSAYSLQALSVLRDLAVGGNQILKVEDAAQSLMSSLGDPRPAVRMDVAEVISRIDQQATQKALADAAFKATGEERVGMLGKLGSSARRYGNKMDARHISRLRDSAMSKDAGEATAAASVLGSLNLSNSQLLPLIAGKK